MTQEKNKHDISGTRIGYWELRFEYFDTEEKELLYGTQKGQYLNGNKNGPWETITKDGAMHTRVSYLNGKKVGVYEYWYQFPNIVRVSGQYDENSQKTGTWKRFRKDGTIREITLFRTSNVIHNQLFGDREEAIYEEIFID